MKKYSWGIDALDKMTGGLQSTLICIYGETGSGKSTLSGYWAIARIAKETIEKEGGIPENGKFYIIDGDGGFDIERAFEVWRGQGLNAEMIEQHVVHKEITDFAEQHKFITKELMPQIEEKEERPLLLTVDPIIASYRGIILRTDPAHRAAVLGNYTGKIDLQLGMLRHIAVNYDCPAIVTTWPSSPIGSSMRESQIRSAMKQHGISREEAERIFPRQETDFIGGRMLGFLPKLIIRLSIPREGDTLREAYLRKARGMPSGKRCYFYLSDAGISPTIQ